MQFPTNDELADAFQSLADKTNVEVMRLEQDLYRKGRIPERNKAYRELRDQLMECYAFSRKARLGRFQIVETGSKS